MIKLSLFFFFFHRTTPMFDISNPLGEEEHMVSYFWTTLKINLLTESCHSNYQMSIKHTNLKTYNNIINTKEVLDLSPFEIKLLWVKNVSRSSDTSLTDKSNVVFLLKVVSQSQKVLTEFTRRSCPSHRTLACIRIISVHTLSLVLTWITFALIDIWKKKSKGKIWSVKQQLSSQVNTSVIVDAGRGGRKEHYYFPKKK